MLKCRDIPFAFSVSNQYLCGHLRIGKAMNTSHLSEQEQIRREKLGDLLGMGIDPYPAELFPVNNHSANIKQQFNDENKDTFKDVCVAGRIMSIRDMGKANFAVIQDSAGRIQLYIKRDDICPGEDKTLYDIIWKKCTDIGDIIGVKGLSLIHI